MTTTIQQKIKAHHELYPALKLNGVQWEHVLYDVLKGEVGTSQIVWNPGSTQEGTDITVKADEDIRISCKSGGLAKDGLVKISGSRLTGLYQSAKDDEDFFTKLAEVDNEDYIFCLSSPNASLVSPKEQICLTKRTYTFSVYKDLFDFSTADWSYVGKPNDFKAVDGNGNKLYIVRAMGYHAWFYANPKDALFNKEIVIDYAA